MLEFSGESKADDDLEKPPLEGDYCNHSKESFGKVEAFEEVHDLEEGKQHDDSDSVADSSEDRSKLLATHAEQRTSTARHGEKPTKDTGIDGDRSESNNAKTNQRVSWRILLIRLSILCRSLRVDEEVWDSGSEDEAKGTDNLIPDNVGDPCTRNVARKLL